MVAPQQVLEAWLQPCLEVLREQVLSGLVSSDLHCYNTQKSQSLKLQISSCMELLFPSYGMLNRMLLFHQVHLLATLSFSLQERIDESTC